MTTRRHRLRHRGEAAARRFLPLMLLAGTVAAVWVAFRGRTFAPHNREDAWILIYVGAAYAIAALFLVVFTRRWTFRGMGQLCTALADAVLYLTSGAIRLGWRDPLSPNEANLIRALFVVGSTLLIAGLFVWSVRGRRLAVTEPSETLDDGTVVYRRRRDDFVTRRDD